MAISSGRSFVLKLAETLVDALGVLAHDDEVYVLRALSLMGVQTPGRA